MRPPICSRSYALGRWRGAMGFRLDVALASEVCWDSYAAGFEHGRDERAARRPVPVRRAFGDRFLAFAGRAA